MELTKLEQLKALASDESLSDRLRESARQQLRSLGELETAIVQQPDEEAVTPAPTKDFVDYRLSRVWKKLPEPRPNFEKWCVSPETKAAIREHDRLVDLALKKSQKDAAVAGEGSGAAITALLVNGEHSWAWTFNGSVGTGWHELWSPANIHTRWARPDEEELNVLLTTEEVKEGANKCE